MCLLKLLSAMFNTVNCSIILSNTSTLHPFNFFANKWVQYFMSFCVFPMIVNLNFSTGVSLLAIHNYLFKKFSFICLFIMLMTSWTSCVIHQFKNFDIRVLGYITTLFYLSISKQEVSLFIISFRHALPWIIKVPCKL